MHCDIIVAPPFTALTAAVEAARGAAISISAQNMCGEAEGALTGEVSAAMLIDAGCRAVIVGHSERRQFFSETDERVNRKIKRDIRAEVGKRQLPDESLVRSSRRQKRRSHFVGCFAPRQKQLLRPRHIVSGRPNQRFLRK